uniref:Uncharacterized protein n=1 Tax=Candidatus Kentrum sp. FM TaxID=2126340 RepID=A0A450TZB6_9GAMM|nr:MAG: hypothetical protein BECKFM1743A_GA0114220_107382 [Candidatus Kentron sp. FM]VFJ75419.1 MAG: hypothetical protein BECKFM1743C_GA0114222_108432 [Candidatus Kentron sp. FM]
MASYRNMADYYDVTDVPHVFTYFRELLPTAQNGTQQID